MPYRFRWVTCQLQMIKDCTDYLMLQRVLLSLPKTLGATYSRILNGISEQYLPYAIRILQFLMFSERALRIDEVVDAVPSSTAGRDTPIRL